MKISAINPRVFRGQTVKERATEPSGLPQPPAKNNVAISGGIALALLGTTAVTGIAHARIPHVISALAALGAALFHVESLAIKQSGRHEFKA